MLNKFKNTYTIFVYKKKQKFYKTFESGELFLLTFKLVLLLLSNNKELIWVVDDEAVDEDVSEENDEWERGDCKSMSLLK